MTTRRAKDDPTLVEIRAVLDRDGLALPEAKVDVYRSNPASIRVRIVSPAFKGLNLVDRDELVWPRLRALLSDDARSDLSLLLLLAPDELRRSLGNREFVERRRELSAARARRRASREASGSAPRAEGRSSDA